MWAQILVILCLLLLGLGLLFSRFFMRIDMTVYGLLFGAVYFLFFPLVYLLLTGKLAVPWWLESVNRGLKDITFGQEAGFLTLLLYIAGIYFLFFLVVLVKRKISQNPPEPPDNSRDVRIYALSIVFYFLLSLYILHSSGILSGGDWYSTKAAFRESGTFALILSYLVWGFRLLIASYTFMLLDQKKISPLLGLLVMGAVCLFELRFVGNRIVVVMFALAGFIFLYRKYGLLKLLPFVLVLLPVALILTLYTQIRHLLFTTNTAEMGKLLMTMLRSSDLTATSLSIFEYSDIVVLMTVFGDVGSVYAPVHGQTFIRFISWFVPRSIWPSKPYNTSIQLGNIYTPGVAPVLLEFGEFHYNFGAWGVLIFPIFTLVIVYLIRLISRQIPDGIYFYFLVGFLIFRFTLVDTFIFVVFAVLIFLCLSFLGRFRFVWRQARQVQE